MMTMKGKTRDKKILPTTKRLSYNINVRKKKGILYNNIVPMLKR